MAIQKMNNQKFAMVLLDMSTSLIEDDKLFKYFNSFYGQRPDSIVFMSHAINAELVENAKKYGVKNLLRKPFTNRTLAEKILKILWKRSRH
jgi:FixJ family two-component response regulator